jgi:hypothetical protein
MAVALELPLETWRQALTAPVFLVLVALVIAIVIAPEMAAILAIVPAFVIIPVLRLESSER